MNPAEVSGLLNFACYCAAQLPELQLNAAKPVRAHVE
jgi:hypothetical protein